MVAKRGEAFGHTWTLAPALIQFMKEANAFNPKRYKRSDGSIASLTHFKQNPKSDHQPRFIRGKWVVTAIDLTHNIEQGIDCHKLTEILRKSKDERIKYVIFNRQIFNSPPFKTRGARARGAWNWGKYTGSNPHTKHMHLSILREHIDNTDNWQFEEEHRPKPKVEKVTDLIPKYLPFDKDDVIFIEAFIKSCSIHNVEPNSLGWIVRAIRALRQEYGDEKMGPIELAQRIAGTFNGE